MKDDHRWHWYHWLILAVVILVGIGIAYTWTSNYDVVRTDDKSYVDSTKQVIEHPINTTENMINDVTK